MSCPRCEGKIFRRRNLLAAAGLAHVCEDCSWPGATRFGRRAGMTALMLSFLPHGCTVLTATHAGAAHLQRYAGMFGRPDLKIRAIGQAKPYRGLDATWPTPDEAEIVSTNPENMNGRDS